VGASWEPEEFLDRTGEWTASSMSTTGEWCCVVGTAGHGHVERVSVQAPIRFMIAEAQRRAVGDRRPICTLATEGR
jgi:hypothetical protein